MNYIVEIKETKRPDGYYILLNGNDIPTTKEGKTNRAGYSLDYTTIYPSINAAVKAAQKKIETRDGIREMNTPAFMRY